MEKLNLTDSARSKLSAGARLSRDDALELYRRNDLLTLARLAREMKERKSGRKVFYRINRHINLTNICSSNCPLCAFQCRAGDQRGYTLERDDISKILDDARTVEGLSEIHIVSALHPTKPFDYYVDVIKQVRAALPTVEIQAFTPVEIINFVKQTSMTIEEVLSTLIEAGLNGLPGGGAEILSDRVRSLICPKKATADEWIEVMRTAHRLRLKTNASMMYGHVETIEERIDHLMRLRELQDETGGFQSMLLFPFHPSNTELGRQFDIKPVGAWENLKMLALSRLVLDNFDHFKAFWIMLTLPIAQLALAFGADDLDGTIGEEKIIHAAGSSEGAGICRSALDRLIREAGFEPTLRGVISCD